MKRPNLIRIETETHIITRRPGELTIEAKPTQEPKPPSDNRRRRPHHRKVGAS